MIALSEHQVYYIANRLDQAGIDYLPLREELLDHLCCMVEDHMVDGLSFSQATHEVFAAFGKDGMQKLQRQTILQLQNKSQLMKRLALLVLGLLLISFTMMWARQQDDPPSRRPLNGEHVVTSAFGQRMHPILKKHKMHFGVDFKAPLGTPVMATSDGEIVKAEFREKYGNMIVIRHDDTFETLYSQLSEIQVKVGQTIKKGEQIGLVGSSGMSTGPHLHYEVHKDGKAVNPEGFFGP